MSALANLANTLGQASVEIERLNKKVAELEAKLENAVSRMDRARDILTNGNPTPSNNWGMLDTKDLK